MFTQNRKSCYSQETCSQAPAKVAAQAVLPPRQLAQFATTSSLDVTARATLRVPRPQQRAQHDDIQHRYFAIAKHT